MLQPYLEGFRKWSVGYRRKACGRLQRGWARMCRSSLPISPWVWATGVGEHIEPLAEVAPRSLLLVNPGISVSAADAYRYLERPLTWNGLDDNPFDRSNPPKNWHDLDQLMGCGNDLQAVVEARHGEIAKIREFLLQQGAKVSQMSGSGSTVFGIFDTRLKAEAAAKSLPAKWAHWVTTTLGNCRVKESLGK